MKTNEKNNLKISLDKLNIKVYNNSIVKVKVKSNFMKTNEKNNCKNFLTFPPNYDIILI